MPATEVTVVHWNPRRNRIPFLSRYEIGRRVNNFGDLAGPRVVAAVVRERGLPAPSAPARLLSVGSIMQFAQDGDVVWGTGVNAKNALSEHRYTTLDVRAVRGPRTRAWLAEHKGIEAPEVYGDPALLIPVLEPRWRDAAQHKKRELLVLPNVRDYPALRDHPAAASPQQSLETVLGLIAGSETVVGSSLHAMVLADALGVPSVLIRSGHEPAFKYEDYYEGTGRSLPPVAADLAEALALLPDVVARHSDPLAAWDPAPLLAAFPADLWEGAAARR